MSNKNKLQEYCQTHGWKLPNYDTHRITGTPAHEPEFTSRVTVNGIDYFGQIGKTKRAAELSAAQEALQKIEKKQELNKIIYDREKPVVILVDLENQPKAVDELLMRINIQRSNIEIRVFVSQNSHLVEQNWTNVRGKVMKHVIPSVRSDAADTYMIFWAGILSRDGGYEKFIIMSRDHFAKTLEECFKFHHNSAIMECNADRVVEALM